MAKKKIMRDNLSNFKTVKRETIPYRPVEDRLNDYKDIYLEYTEDQMKIQASRCQDCGVPFCHGFGCPLGNEIPDWNELVYQGRWDDACELLHSTNNFPEITGRVCPALCEDACTLNLGLGSVTIRNVELTIVEKGFANGWIKPVVPENKTGKKIAVIGSGPAGLAAAQQLCRKGHDVTIFERDEKLGGFLRYGIPDFKLEKWVLDRRIKQMVDEGLKIKTNCHVGNDVTVDELVSTFDAVILANGSRDPRDLPVEGRELEGIYLATDYLSQSNKRVDGIQIADSEKIDAKGKNVVIIGGGDTGADCVGTARRQGAKDIYQLEILPKPPEKRADETPWPMFAKKLRTSSSHDEGCERRWCVTTKKFVGSGKVEKIEAAEIKWKKDDAGKFTMVEVEGSQFELKADIVFLAMGFVHPVHDTLIKELGVNLDPRGNIQTDKVGFGKVEASGGKGKIFAAGDAARGASLVVWAIMHGRDVAEQVDHYLES